MRPSLRMSLAARPSGFLVLVVGVLATHAVTAAQASPAPSCVVSTQAPPDQQAGEHTLSLANALPRYPLRLTTARENSYGAMPDPPTPGNSPSIGDGPGAAAVCAWQGPDVTPSGPYYLTHSIDATLSVIPWASPDVARHAFALEHSGGLSALPAGAPPSWSLDGVGDSALYIPAVPQDGNAEIEVLSGAYTFSIAVTAEPAVFERTPPPWTVLALAVVAQLKASTTPPFAYTPPAQPPPCASAQPTAADRTVARQLGEHPSWNDVAVFTADLDPSQVRRMAGLLNALAVTQINDFVTRALAFDIDDRPLDAVIYADVVKALEACALSQQFIAAAVTTPDDADQLNTFYGSIKDDDAASLGLMRPMSPVEIMQGLSYAGSKQASSAASNNPDPGREVDYDDVADTALAQDVDSLLAQGKKLNQGQAAALDQLATLGYYGSADAVAGGQGTRDVLDFFSSPLKTTAAVRNEIHQSLSAAPPAGSDFAAGNARFRELLPQRPPAEAPNDAFGDLQYPTAQDTYLRNWALRAGLLAYDASAPLGIEVARGITNLAESIAIAKDFVCALGGDPGLVVCTNADLSSAVETALSDDHSDLSRELSAVAKDVFVDKPAASIPGLGLAFDLAFDSGEGADAATTERADTARGALTCATETQLETTVLATLQRADRLVSSGPTLTRMAPEEAYAVNYPEGNAYLTLADATGRDTGTPVFPLINNIQSEWRGLIGQQLTPAQFEKGCPLGGSDPTLASYQQTLTGSGYAPDSSVTIIGHSKEVLLAVTRADDRGHFGVRVDPRLLGPGHHTLIAAGATASGRARSLRWRVRVGHELPGGASDTTARDLTALAAATLGLTLLALVTRRRRGGRLTRTDH